VNGSVRDAKFLFRLHDGHSSVTLNQLSYFFNQENSGSFLTALHISSHPLYAPMAYTQTTLLFYQHLFLYKARSVYKPRICICTCFFFVVGRGFGGWGGGAVILREVRNV